MHGQAFEAAFAAQPRPLPQGTQAIPDSVARVGAQGIDIEVQGLPVAVRGKQLELFPETPEIVEPAGAWTQSWNGAVWRAHVPLSPQRSTSPSALPVVVADGAHGWRASLTVAGTWPPAPAAPVAGVSPALQEALRSNAAGTPQPSSVASGPARRPARRAAGRPDPQPDALRVPGAGDQAGGLHRACAGRACPPRRRPGLHRRRGALVPGAGRGDARPARRRRATRLGLPAAVADRRGAAGAALHADRAQPRRRCSSSAPSCLRRSRRSSCGIRCATRSSRACSPWPSHRRAPRRSWAPRSAWPPRCPRPRRCCVFGVLGAGMALPYLAASAVPAVGALAAASGPVDGHLPPPDGLPDVRHRRVAGVGAGPAKRHRRRRCAARAAGRRQPAGVDAHAAAAAHAPCSARWPSPPCSRWPGPSARTSRPPRRRRRPHAPTAPGSPGRKPRSSSSWPRASRCSSTSPPPGASPAR